MSVRITKLSYKKFLSRQQPLSCFLAANLGMSRQPGHAYPPGRAQPCPTRNLTSFRPKSSPDYQGGLFAYYPESYSVGTSGMMTKIYLRVVNLYQQFCDWNRGMYVAYFRVR